MALRNAGWRVDDRTDWLPLGLHLWSVAQGRLGARLRVGLRIFFSSLWQAISLLRLSKNKSVVYVPYPAPFLLWWLSWVPRRWRPRCIADAYISIWDSMYRDRSTHSRSCLVSSMVQRFEARALASAESVLTDTEANADWMSQDFGIPHSRFQSIPLGIYEEHLLAVPPKRVTDKPVRVLFVGTLIPLHGIETLITAMHILDDDPGVEFRLIGDGQQAYLVEQLQAECASGKVVWLRNWLDATMLSREIAAADICLGIFGGDGKAARVLPFKIYMYLAAGRPVISQHKLSCPKGVVAPPMVKIPANPESLAKAIVNLAQDEGARALLAKRSRQYYIEFLSNRALVRKWTELVAG